MKKLVLSLIVTMIFIAGLSNTSKASSNDDSLYIHKLRVFYCYINDFVSSEFDLKRDLYVYHVETNHPLAYKKISMLDGQAVRCIRKAIKEDVGSKKQFAFIDKAFKKFLEARLLCDDLIKSNKIGLAPKPRISGLFY